MSSPILPVSGMPNFGTGGAATGRAQGQVCMPKSMVIIAAGPIGMLNALYALGQGCPRTFLVDRSQARLDWAVTHDIVTNSENN